MDRCCDSPQRSAEALLPEYVGGSAEEILLLLVAVAAHPSVDDVEQRLHQTHDERTASLPGHEDLDQVQHLQRADRGSEQILSDGG